MSSVRFALLMILEIIMKRGDKMKNIVSKAIKKMCVKANSYLALQHQQIIFISLKNPKT